MTLDARLNAIERAFVIAGLANDRCAACGAPDPYGKRVIALKPGDNGRARGWRNHSVMTLAGRTPRALSAPDGVSLLRFAERAMPAGLMKPPPRSTRAEAPFQGVVPRNAGR